MIHAHAAYSDITRVLVKPLVTIRIQKYVHALYQCYKPV